MVQVKLVTVRHMFKSFVVSAALLLAFACGLWRRHLCENGISYIVLNVAADERVSTSETRSFLPLPRYIFLITSFSHNIHSVCYLATSAQRRLAASSVLHTLRLGLSQEDTKKMTNQR